MGLRGALTGALGLLVLHALVARANQNQLSGLVAVAVGTTRRFLDPNIPAISNRGEGGTAITTAAASTAQSTGSAIASTYPTPTKR